MNPFINAPTSLEEALNNRAIRDILAQRSHPNKFKNEQGFSYLDYALWAKDRGWYGKHLLTTILKITEGARQAELKEAIVRG